MRLSGEIGTKSKGTQERMIFVLKNYLNRRARRYGIKMKIKNKFGKFWIDGYNSKHVTILRTAPGVGRFSLCYAVKLNEWKRVISKIIPKSPFYPFFFVYKASDVEFSKEFKKEVMEYLTALQIETFSKVKEKRELPVEIEELSIGAEIHGDTLILWRREYTGLRGLPYACDEAKVGVLFSGGPDSTLAALKMATRGVEICLLYFDVGVDELTKRVFETASAIADVTPGGAISLIRVPWDSILSKYREHYKKQTCLVCKTLMLKAAARVAKLKGWSFIVTGSIVGEQASQTPYAIEKIERFLEVPVLHPLCGYSKEQVFEELQQIGLRKLVEKALPACPFVPQKVVAKPRFNPRDIVLPRFRFEEQYIPAVPSWNFDV